ncbi:MAG TPA: hypothetical protein VGC55_16550 [Dokdonella sp.]
MLPIQPFGPLVIDPMPFVAQLPMQLRTTPRRTRVSQIEQARLRRRHVVDTAPMTQRSLTDFVSFSQLTAQWRCAGVTTCGARAEGLADSYRQRTIGLIPSRRL